MNLSIVFFLFALNQLTTCLPHSLWSGSADNVNSVSKIVGTREIGSFEARDDDLLSADDNSQALDVAAPSSGRSPDQVCVLSSFEY